MAAQLSAEDLRVIARILNHADELIAAEKAAAAQLDASSSSQDQERG
jgi:hypothetical protein